MNKSIFKVLDSKNKTLGVFLSVSEDSLKKYIQEKQLFANQSGYSISKLNDEDEIEEETAPILVSHRKLWYDLRHEKYILIFDEEEH